MGFIIKFLLGFVVIYFLLKSFLAFLIGKRGRQASNSRQQFHQNKKPESQEDRIMEYQKKKFEASEIEDVDFEEVEK